MTHYANIRIFWLIYYNIETATKTNLPIPMWLERLMKIYTTESSLWHSSTKCQRNDRLPLYQPNLNALCLVLPHIRKESITKGFFANSGQLPAAT